MTPTKRNPSFSTLFKKDLEVESGKKVKDGVCFFIFCENKSVGIKHKKLWMDADVKADTTSIHISA